MLANSPEPSTLVVLAVLLTISTFLPTAATVYITGKGLYVAADYVADSVAEEPNPPPASGQTTLCCHDPSQGLDNIIILSPETTTPCAQNT